ncbi:MAG: alpha/beta fold hydrolase [Actinobacteria bacterium]|nr:alpha/beta fold hydrolase [Actinomycetota bacterium]
MGLGASAIAWPDEMCWAFVGRGFHVVRFDNRDCGRSTVLADRPVDLATLAMSFFSGGTVEAPYRLSDMASDTVGLLDALGVERAHVLGASLGGMVAQTLAIDHPTRVASLTSLMSTTGEADVLLPDADVLPLLLTPPPADRNGAIAAAVHWIEVVGSPDHLDREAAADLAARAYDRGFHPEGTVRQLAAVLASGSRADALAQLRLPTLVIHGTEDRLLRPEGGRRTAELVPGARLVEVPGMGHDLPPAFWSVIVEQVTALAASTA